jgi:carbamoyl-phosphate synthase small subunit
MKQNKDIPPFINKPNAALILENKMIFWGNGLGAKTAKIGELCFNTSQTGYQEILTDPSYAKQIITFTFPHIGIVGVNDLDVESKKIHASGCILNQPSNHYSSWRGNSNIDLFFTQNNIPCITNIDTRQLTRILASKGAMKAAIIHFDQNKQTFEDLKIKLDKWSGLENLDLASIVTTSNSYTSSESVWQINKNKYFDNLQPTYNISCLDFGIKKNILRNLNNCNLSPTVLPANTSLKNILKTEPKGIFLSNGPGDPFATGNIIIPTIKEIIKRKIPIFGICLGHQILSLALGAKTKKMFQGHRGGNHPVKNLITERVEITSQNHGFEVDRNSFSNDVIETHVSLFDGSNEGIKHKNLPIFSVQYHPEASPGPHDSHYLFNQFYDLVKKYA